MKEDTIFAWSKYIESMINVDCTLNITLPDIYVDNLWSELQRTGAGGEMEFNKIVDYVESPQLASKLKKRGPETSTAVVSE